MPIDFQQVYLQIKAIGSEAQRHQEALRERRAQARQLFERFADQTSWLQERLQKALRVQPDLRCAIPLEPLSTRYPPPKLEKTYTLLAADGSQIAPDRHAQVLFGLVNIGLIELHQGSDETPHILTESHLLFDEELYHADGNLIADSELALQRDLRERTLLAERAREAKKPAIALTDGPLELWGAKELEERQAYRKELERHLSFLRNLAREGVVIAGYVDKPMANLVVRLLEIANLPENELARLKESFPLRGVSDRWLFGEPKHPLLRSGERTAVFGLQSRSREFYRHEIALHFFYLNVGSEEHPWPVRVEVPAWVAQEKSLLDLLHVALLEQCRLMGARPYPYLLHRAHEIAVVTWEEKSQLENLLAIELRGQGQEVDEASAKQSGKDASRRSS
ncbi:MAG: DNA double-strand break repair nuclease NurA [Anaerolineales bacterium]